jgi:hypothetical protein
LNRYAYVQNNPVNLIDPSGEFALPVAVALGFLAVKAGGGLVAWGGLQIATHWIGNPVMDSDNPYENYRLSNLVNDASGAVAALNTGLGAGIVAIEVGVALYPTIIVAAGTPSRQKLLSNATDFISAAVPSTSPIPNLSGLAGQVAGEMFKSLEAR